MPFLLPGTPVTTSRTDVEYVVTEYGIAKLAGQTVTERTNKKEQYVNNISSS